MAEQPRFLAVLQAVDKITAPINGILSKVRGLGDAVRSDFASPWQHATASAGRQIAGVGHAAKKTGEEIGRSGHGHVFSLLSAHVKVLRTHFGNLNAGIGEVGHSLSDLLPMLAGLGGIASLGGLAEMMEHVAAQQSTLENTAAALGLATHHLLALNLAAEHADVPVQEMQTGFERFNAVLGKAAHGGNKAALSLFQHLGISLTDAHGHVKTLTQLMPRLMDAFAATHSQATRSAMAMTLFGRAGIKLLPILDQGAAGWRRFNAESRKVDYDPTEKERRGLEKFHSAWIDLRHAVDSVKTAIAARLGPVLQPIVDQFGRWVANNREWIAQKVVDAVKGLAHALKTIHIKSIVEDFGRLAKDAVRLSGAIGPMPTVIGALTLALGSPLLHAVTGAIRDFKELVTWAYNAATAIGSTLVGAIKAAGTAIEGLDAKFHGTTIGRMAMVTFALWDAAHAQHAVRMNSAQKQLAASWHLKPGQALTGRQTRAFDHLATPATHAGPDFSARMRTAIAHALGLSGPAPRGPFAAGLASGAAGAMGPAPGQTRVIVDFKNVPAGTRISNAPTRGGAPAELNVGYNHPAFGY